MDANDPVTAETSQEPATPDEAASRAPRSLGTWLGALGLLVAVAVLVLQVVTLQTAREARDTAGEAADSASALASDVGELRTEVGDVTESVDELEATVAAGDLSEVVEPGGTSNLEVAGPLPPYPTSGVDPAVEQGMRVAAITGTDYYSGEQLTVSPDGDRATVWLVWAHWCPHCQDELPDLSEFWNTSADDFPHVDVVTITTSIDDTRGNPLVPYLDEAQFPFPVLVDDTGELAGMLGTTAFPFWVVTGPDGEVLFRRPGALGLAQVTGLVTSVEEFVAG